MSQRVARYDSLRTLTFQPRRATLRRFSSDDNDAREDGANERGLVVKHSSQLVIKNTVSTAADHLYNKLTWAGLGSDFNKPADSDDETENGEAKSADNWAAVEKGRAGVARGYKVNADDDRT